MALFAGLDVGSLFIKGALMRGTELVATEVCPAGQDATGEARRLLSRLLDRAGAQGATLDGLVATGAGRMELSEASSVANEVLAVSRGAPYFCPGLRGVMDLGGESTRIVTLDDRGEIIEYTQNEKCASGTGIFLDAMAKVMDLPLSEMGPRSLLSVADITINSTCVAFAESEVVSLVHNQTPRRDILRGMHRAIAARIFGMVHRVGLSEGPILATGGLALNVGVVRGLEELMGVTLVIPENPQVVPAVGAARLAAQRGGER